MAPIVFPTTTVAPNSSDLSLQAWFLIGAAIYLVAVLILVIICQCFKESISERFHPCFQVCCYYCFSRACILGCSTFVDEQKGFCAECTCGTTTDDGSCCECCIACAQFCNCNVPDLRSCCDAICGPRRRCDIGDCLACGGGCCGGCECPSCPSCPGFQGPNCDCSCPSCTQINCCCIRIQFV